MIQQLLDEPDDFKLCSGIVDKLYESYPSHGERFDLANMGEHERVVVRVWHSFGVIGNGGFQYLFEATYSDDPDFALVAAAYRTIGCDKAADAFSEALALFPDGRPPENLEQRQAIFSSVRQEVRERIDHEFWDSSKDIEAKLAAYIRANRAIFQRLLAPGSCTGGIPE